MDSRVLLETRRFRVVEHTLADNPSNRQTRAVVEHPGAAVILPLLGDSRSASESSCRVVLIRNHRVAVGKTMIELPAGTIEPAEPPLETAKRELAEETGYSAQKWTSLPGFFMSPGILNERMHCFVAEDLTAGSPARETGEEIENLVVPVDDAFGMIECGEIEDAKTIAVLMHWHAFLRA